MFPTWISMRQSLQYRESLSPPSPSARDTKDAPCFERDRDRVLGKMADSWDLRRPLLRWVLLLRFDDDETLF